MSIAQLLRHVGIDVPRYVTVDGQVVFDPAVAGLSQPAPLAMSPHRFHGGVDPSPPRDALTDAWWKRDPDARAADVAAMARHFPGFQLIEEGGDYVYGGRINTGRGAFRVLVLPHSDGSMPTIVPVHRNLGRDIAGQHRKPPHLYLSGSLCVAAESNWNPVEHSTATVVGWAAHWFAAYTDWRLSARWPTDGYGQVA